MFLDVIEQRLELHLGLSALRLLVSQPHPLSWPAKMLYCPLVGSAPLLAHEFVRGTNFQGALRKGPSLRRRSLLRFTPPTVALSGSCSLLSPCASVGVGRRRQTEMAGAERGARLLYETGEVATFVGGETLPAGVAIRF